MSTFITAASRIQLLQIRLLLQASLINENAVLIHIFNSKLREKTFWEDDSKNINCEGEKRKRPLTRNGLNYKNYSFLHFI